MYVTYVKDKIENYFPAFRIIQICQYLSIESSIFSS